MEIFGFFAYTVMALILQATLDAPQARAFIACQSSSAVCLR